MREAGVGGNEKIAPDRPIADVGGGGNRNSSAINPGPIIPIRVIHCGLGLVVKRLGNRARDARVRILLEILERTEINYRTAISSRQSLPSVKKKKTKGTLELTRNCHSRTVKILQRFLRAELYVTRPASSNPGESGKKFLFSSSSRPNRPKTGTVIINPFFVSRGGGWLCVPRFPNYGKSSWFGGKFCRARRFNFFPFFTSFFGDGKVHGMFQPFE